MAQFELDAFNKWKQSAKVIVESDMNKDMESEAAVFAQDGIERNQDPNTNGVNYEGACKHIKENMDKHRKRIQTIT